jgi:hypothetical protein
MKWMKNWGLDQDNTNWKLLGVNYLGFMTLKVNFKRNRKN